MIPFINTNGGGLLRSVIIIFVILLLLGYFGLNIQSIVNSPTFQNNWGYLKGIVISLWNTVFVPKVIQPVFNDIADSISSSTTHSLIGTSTPETL